MTVIAIPLLVFFGLMHNTGAQVSGVEDVLAEQMAGVAAKITRSLVQRSEMSVALGHFTVNPSSLGAETGQVVKNALWKALNGPSAGLTVKSKARYQIDGEVFVKADEQLLKANAKITIRVKDKHDDLREVESHAVTTEDPHVLAVLTGSNVTFPPGKRPAPHNETLVSVIADRTQSGREPAPLRIEDNTLLVGAYGVRIRVARQGRFTTCPLRAGRTDEAQGQAVVNLNKGDDYVVQLVNNSGTEAAVELRIDGLSMFNFTTERDEQRSPRHRFVLVSADETTDIPGWYVTRTQTDRFRIAQIPADKLSGSNTRQLDYRAADKVGTITASVHRAWEPGKRPLTHGNYFTDRGPSAEQHYRELEREVGDVEAVLTIRYEVE